MVTLVLAQTWMHPGFHATYNQFISNSGLLALRGREFDITLTYTVLDVNKDMVTLKINGTIVAQIQGKNVKKVVNTTVTVNPNWNNVSLPFLTKEKLDALKQKAKYECNNETCIFYIKGTQTIPNHNMLFKINGTETIDTNAMILKSAYLKMKLYIVKNNITRQIGLSISKVKLVEYGYGK